MYSVSSATQSASYQRGMAEVTAFGNLGRVCNWILDRNGQFPPLIFLTVSNLYYAVYTTVTEKAYDQVHL